MGNNAVSVNSRIQNILDGVQDPCFIVAPDCQITFMNGSAKKLAQPELCEVGKNICCEIFCNKESLAGRENKSAFLATGVVTQGDASKSFKKMFNSLYEISARPLSDEHGTIQEVLVVFRNAPEENPVKVQGEKSQKEQIDKLQNTLGVVEKIKTEWEMIMDCLQEMVILVNEDNEVIRCNFPFSTFLKSPFENIIGRSCKELLKTAGLQDGTYTEEEKGKILSQKESGKYYLLRQYSVTDVNGYQGKVVTLLDITKRKQAQIELATNKERLQNALTKLSKMIIQVVTEQEIGSGFSMTTQIPPCWEMMHCVQEDCPRYGKGPGSCWLEVGTFCNGEVQGDFAKKYGMCQKCKFYKRIQQDSVSHIVLQFNYMMEVLGKKNVELQKACSELKASQSQLLQQEKMASIGQLAAGVAHEINNPIGFVTSNLGSLCKYVDKIKDFISKSSEAIEATGNVVLEKDVQEKRQKLKIDFVMADIDSLIKESLDGVGRVREIVRNLKNFSRVDQSATVRSDINNCLEETLNIVWNEIKYKATVQKDYGELPYTLCNPQQLNQVFMNLLVNAVQAIEEKGEITIKTWANEKNIYVSIQDTGCGIPEENVGKLFEPFFTTKEIGKGTGLGLSITYDLVKKHEGEITVVSELGKGSVFTVRIPVKNEDQ